MKMNIESRLVILANLPQQGSLLEMMTARNIRRKIEFSSEEMNKLNLKEINGKISWNSSSELLNVDFTDQEKEFLKSIIKIMDSKHIIIDGLLDFIQEIQS